MKKIINVDGFKIEVFAKSREELILDEIKKNKYTAPLIMAEKLGLPLSTISYMLNKMANENLIVDIGSNTLITKNGKRHKCHIYTVKV